MKIGATASIDDFSAIIYATLISSNGLTGTRYTSRSLWRD